MGWFCLNQRSSWVESTWAKDRYKLARVESWGWRSRWVGLSQRLRLDYPSWRTRQVHWAEGWVSWLSPKLKVKTSQFGPKVKTSLPESKVESSRPRLKGETSRPSQKVERSLSKPNVGTIQSKSKIKTSCLLQMLS